MTTLDPIERAIADIAAGRPVVVVDDADRENEGDLIFAAEKVTAELIAFMMTSCRGLICVPMEATDLERLDIADMVEHNTESQRTAFTVTVDAAEGVTTGISAADRARTIAVLNDPESEPKDLVRPGHIFPLRADRGGVLQRAGHTEAAVDLARLAGLRGAGVICEIAADDGTMMRLPALREFATEHDLALISIADLISYRHRTEGRFGEVYETNTETTPTNRLTEDAEHGVEQAVTTVLPTEYGRFTAVGYRSLLDDTEHVALVCGDIGDGTDILVRVHSECLTGDAFGSLRCDCGPQLRAAMSAVAAEGRGIVLYMRGHEGRGIGLMDKLRAYRLQDTGRDTVDANLDLGLPADARDYGIGARILADLGVQSMRLLTNNPAKHAGLEGHGITVTGRVKLPTTVRPENLSYLRAKRDRMGHLLEDLPVEAVA